MTERSPTQEDQTADEPHVQFEDPLLDKLTGEWRMTRKIRDSLEENLVQVEWVLNHQFLRIHMLDVKTPATYEALVLVGFNHELGLYVIYWLDTFGGKYSEKGTGSREGDAIRFVFQYPDGLLHNTFTWNPENGTWRALIEQQDENGNWLVFAEDSLKRV